MKINFYRKIKFNLKNRNFKEKKAINKLNFYKSKTFFSKESVKYLGKYTNIIILFNKSINLKNKFYHKTSRLLRFIIFNLLSTSSKKKNLEKKIILYYIKKNKSSNDIENVMIRFPNIKLASNFFQKVKFYDIKDVECDFLKFFSLEKTYIYKKLDLFKTSSIEKKNSNLCKLNCKKRFCNLIKTSEINLKCIFNKSLIYNFLIGKKNKSFTTIFNCIFLKTLI